MTDWRVRARRLLDERFALLAGGLAVLLLLGGWLTVGAYAGTADRTVTEQRVVGSWETTGSYQHAARVTEETQLFERGRLLENRSAYFQRVSPLLTGQYRFDFESSVDGRLDVTATQRVMLRQVAGRDDQQTVVWERTRRTGTVSETLAPGENLTVPFSFNATALAVRAGEINDGLGVDRGETKVLLVTSVTYEGSVANRELQRRENHTATLQFEGGTYRIAGATNRTEAELTEPVTVDRPPGFVAGVGGPLLFAVGFFGLAGLVAGRAQGLFAVPEAERALARHRQARDELGEWVTVGELPGEMRDRPVVSVDDLQGLVDVAIDTDERVIEDATDGRYYVVHDGHLYEYEPPVGEETEDEAAGDGASGVG
jgi:hypothetical protein